MSAAPVAVDFGSFASPDEALALCARTGLAPATAEHSGFLLVQRNGRLALERTGGGASLEADFLSAAFLRRLRTTSGSQPLARAIGLRTPRPEVLDATAGLCRDAFVLAHLGCTVSAVERSPALFALAEDGLRRVLRDAAARGASPAARACARLTLSCGDARAWFEQQGRFDVVYLDPMYPQRSKAALGKQELRLVAELVGDRDEDARQLGELALGAARVRVVVKRPLRAPPLLGEPDHSQCGKMARYDVHLVRSGKRA